MLSPHQLVANFEYNTPGSFRGPMTVSDKFDPLAYIENAFLDKPGQKTAVKERDEENLEIELPSIGSYLSSNSVAEPTTKKKSKLASASEGPKTKFRRRKLSSPRPRRVKETAAESSAIDPGLQEVWNALPKNITFLSGFFDDSVTANYYRGEFKESREELIRRLLDPELSLEEVSRLLGVCPATVRRYTNRNWLEHHRTQGGQRRFRLSGVVKFVDQHGRHPEG